VRVGVPLAALAALAALACWDAPTAAPGPTPVVSLVLTEGESLQVASVTLGTPGDSSIPPDAVPVAAGDVSLRVEDDSGNAWPLSETGTPGRFGAAVPIRRGARYRLRGAVMGRPIDADTRVPSVFNLVNPPGQTLTSADTVPCRWPAGVDGVCLRLVVESDGSGGIGCQVRDQTGPISAYCFFLGDTGDVELLAPERVREIVLMTWNHDASLRRLRHPMGAPENLVWRFGVAVTLKRQVEIR